MSSSTNAMSPVRLVATVVAAVFLLVGVAGFIPGLTTNFDDLTFAGHESGAELLGIFGVSVLHNAVHILFGVAGFVLAGTSVGAVRYLIGGGIIYLVLAAYGAFIDLDSGINFVPVNAADNVLHLALGVVMTGAGLAMKSGATDRY